MLNVRRRRRELVLWLAGVTSLAAGCREVAPTITAVRIRAEFPGKTFSQLQFWLRGSTLGSELFPAALRPQPAADLLTSPQDLVVYVDDRLAETGQHVVCGVRGFFAGFPGAGAEREVALALHETATCTVLLAVSVDADPPRAEDGGTTFMDAATASDVGGPPTEGSDASPDHGPP